MMSARVSRPTARVMFSDVAVVSDFDGQSTLMVRMANRRLSQIVQAEFAISLVCNERTREGIFMRRFYDLKTVHDRTPVFVDATQSLRDIEAEMLITLTGLDENIGQNVHARMSYLPDEIMFGYRFADMFGYAPDGRRAIDFRHLHATWKVQSYSGGE
jgi:inward rectifier potassium channel